MKDSYGFFSGFFFGIIFGIILTFFSVWIYTTQTLTQFSLLSLITLATQKALPYIILLSIAVVLFIIYRLFLGKVTLKEKVVILDEEFKENSQIVKNEYIDNTNTLEEEFKRKNLEKTIELNVLREKIKILEKNQSDPRKNKSLKKKKKLE
jgi:hypothetical protein